MTNEELAVLIKNGHKEYYSQLWENVYKLFVLKAHRFYNSNKQRCIKYGIEESDLIQSCFYALVLAVEAYSPDSGFALTTYTNYHIANIFGYMVNLRGKKRFEENNCTSLNIPVGEEEFELGELIPDETAQEELERVDYDMTLSQLRAVLDSITSELPPIEAQVIDERFYQQKTWKAIGESLNTTPDTARATEFRALNHIRHSKRRKELEPFRDELIGCLAYRNTGLTSFKQKNGSSVELTFEKAERAKRNG